MSAEFVIGDIHGQYNKLRALLQGGGLIDNRLHWTGGAAHLWFMGDFFDRGPDGIGSLELVMRLQTQAEASGGRVQALLGNHDMLLLATYHFGQNRAGLMEAFEAGRDLTPETIDFFTANWLQNGGRLPDLNRLTRKHVVWLSNLPAMARSGDTLLIHADSTLYQRFGDSVEQVNAFFHRILEEGSAEEWIRVLDAFSEHSMFTGKDGAIRVLKFLKIFDAARLVHAHTPIINLTRETPTEAFVYHNGLCTNVDHGLYLGGSGFVYRL